MKRMKKATLITALIVTVFSLALYGNHLACQQARLMAITAEDSDAVEQPATDFTASTTTQKTAPQLTNHVVAAGETLDSIASAYGTDSASLISINDLSTTTIREGQKLQVLDVKGVVHEVTSGDTLWDIARAYRVALEVIVEANPGISAAALQLGKDLIIPGGTKPVARTAVASRGSASTSTSSNSRFAWPVTSHKINSGFGPRSGGMHQAIDIGVATGTTVRAAAAGTVTYAGWATGYGYLVKIAHASGYETRYGHNSQLLVKVGQKVTQGQTIAHSGSTGNSTGPHLHFEIRLDGTPLNPLTLLPR